MSGLRSKRFSDGLECLRDRLKNHIKNTKENSKCRRLKFQPFTTEAVHLKAFSSNAPICRPLRNKKARRATKSSCAYSAAPTLTANRLTVWATPVPSTSKAVISDKSERADHDVDYLFGQVSIDKPFVDWSGNCGNLTAAVGAFAIEQGLVDKSKIPSDGICTVKIWQKNIGKTIIAHVPMQNGAVLETGDFELDGVIFRQPKYKSNF